MIHVCHRCKFGVRAVKVATGSVPCLADPQGRDIAEVSREGCPKGYFDKCERCGGKHHVSACPIPPDTSPEIEQRRARSGGCCGSPSRD